MQIKSNRFLFVLGSWHGKNVVVFTVKINSEAKADLE